ncbi:hypothetical protein BS47DRAFT_1364394 [Hydnum rufescens UP504]|uniref:Uncharacterized protein n=1 Tax=Hydnum rufescens UP504 TaxID=1448309 RepID=A0A9P6ARJ5_9AGAM|nr:hypothetical protein BS47DRAFT_1364394 [Hydnum rufescens UP504]
MVPHTAAADPLSLCEIPAKLCADKAQSEIWGCMQPPSTSTQPLQRRIKYSATGTLVLSPSMKPDPENAQTMHHEIQEFKPEPERLQSTWLWDQIWRFAQLSSIPWRYVLPKLAKTEPKPNLGIPSHTPALVGFLTLQNPHPKNPWTRPGQNMGVRAATQDLNPRVSPTPTMTNQVLSPSVKPNLENAQTMHHETQECTATQDPDSRVPTTHMMKQVQCHTPALADFLTPQNPCPKNPWRRPGVYHGAKRAALAALLALLVLSPSAQPHLKNATQDPNPEYQR